MAHRMDTSDFLEACNAIIGSQQERKGIGTLGEKTLHAVVKRYFEPLEQNCEVRVGPYVADILGEQGIIEIQTRSFDRLRAKLAFFLQEHTVTVVYPVPAQKWLVWVDENGETSPRRKSPKKYSPCEIFYELYKIKSMLKEPNLQLCILLVDLEEYRLKNGWSEDGKRGSTRFDRMPIALEKEIWIRSPVDYRRLIPSQLPETFTGKEFAKAAGLSASKGTTALNVLLSVGAVERMGKQGRAYLYCRSK